MQLDKLVTCTGLNKFDAHSIVNTQYCFHFHCVQHIHSNFFLIIYFFNISAWKEIMLPCSFLSSANVSEKQTAPHHPKIVCREVLSPVMAQHWCRLSAGVMPARQGIRLASARGFAGSSAPSPADRRALWQEGETPARLRRRGLSRSS